ncbi:protein-tyrosine phosphatase family protein [Photobacterium halotolerans]|uniref:protein-tyrosine phosphatase family protein n=1 Tax=Photobacterium halotolerans TaxID=265726 RepID=UPI000480DD66|nr:dual specificity protein phosphatase [Photobacterium halotolerans]
MKDLFFIDESVSGRCGPDKLMWDLDELKRNNIRAILSVNDGELVHTSRLSELGIVYGHIPLSSNVPIQSGDLEFCVEALPRIVEFINKNRTEGIVLIHCKSGKDRTGLALATYLMQSEGYEVKEAMKAVKNIRNIAFTAPGWSKFSVAVLTELKNT